ncbi:hypothetical protein Tco_0218011 [Tanacetum coccineum]
MYLRHTVDTHRDRAKHLAGTLEKMSNMMFEGKEAMADFQRKKFDEGYFTLRGLKGSKPSGSVFNILFNLNRFIAYESRDPFLIPQNFVCGDVRNGCVHVNHMLAFEKNASVLEHVLIVLS